MTNATVGANARSMSKAKPTRIVGADLPDDLSFLPERYAMPVVGDCLAPEVRDGAVLIVNKAMPYKVGDLVIVFRRGATPSDQPLAMVKRLLMAPPPWVTIYPYRDHPNSDVLAIVAFEQLNPHKRFTMRCADILAIHKCVEIAPADAARAMLTIREA